MAKSYNYDVWLNKANKTLKYVEDKANKSKEDRRKRDLAYVPPKPYAPKLMTPPEKQPTFMKPKPIGAYDFLRTVLTEKPETVAPPLTYTKPDLNNLKFDTMSNSITSTPIPNRNVPKLGDLGIPAAGKWLGDNVGMPALDFLMRGGNAVRLGLKAGMDNNESGTGNYNKKEYTTEQYARTPFLKDLPAGTKLYNRTTLKEGKTNNNMLNVLNAVKSGLTGEKKLSTLDMLYNTDTAVGRKKLESLQKQYPITMGAIGLTGDVLSDPTTFITGLGAAKNVLAKTIAKVAPETAAGLKASKFLSKKAFEKAVNIKYANADEAAAAMVNVSKLKRAPKEAIAAYTKNAIGNEISKDIVKGITSKRDRLYAIGDLAAGKGLPQSASIVSNIAESAMKPIGNISESTGLKIPQRNFKLKDGTFANKQPKYNLPDDENALKTMVANMEDQQRNGIKINLQLFANAQAKLKAFKSTLVNPAPTIDRIVTGVNKPKGFMQKAKDTFSDLYTNWVSPFNSINKIDKRVGMLAENSKKVNATSDYIINKGLVDKNGDNIGESFKSIVNSVPKNDYKKFSDYILHKHNIDRSLQEKPIFSDYSPAQSEQMVLAYEQSNPEFKAISQKLDSFMDNFSKSWLRDTGRITDQQLAEMKAMYPHYVPTQREISELERISNTGVKSGFAGQNTGVMKATGSDKNVIDPFMNILDMINRTVRSSRKNEVMQGIADTVAQKQAALSGYAEILPKNYQGALDKDNIVRVLISGEPTYMKINDKRLLEALVGISDTTILGPKAMKMFGAVFKGLITQKNPFFAIRNVMRDIPSSYIYGSTKNPIKFTSDLVKASKDIIKNTSVRQKYQAIGGGQAQFINTGEKQLDTLKTLNEIRGVKTLTQKAMTPFDKAIKGVEKFNSFTEEAPRLAEFKRVLAKTNDVQQALHAAGEITVNFSRGGKYAKNVDAYVPYFNAGIQGLDKFARTAKNNPKKLLVGGTVAITMPTIAQEVLWNTVDPEGYKNIDNRTKDNYFVIPTGKGKEPLKIPKSRELAVLFSSLLQRIYRTSQGEEDSFKDFSNTVATNFSPANPIDANYVTPILNLKANKDFANRDIVPKGLEEEKPYLQYDEKTTSIAKKIGEISNNLANTAAGQAIGFKGLSPKQIDYIVKSYTGVIGQAGIPLFQKGGSPLKAITSQFTVNSSNNAETDKFYDTRTKLSQEAKENNKINNIATDEVTDQEKLANMYGQGSKIISEFRKQINATDDDNKQKEIRKKLNDFSKSLNEFYKTKPTRNEVEMKYDEISWMLKQMKFEKGAK